jgi:D-glycero-alpha-D-manno-heptose 1-phosphate guanylyltransferase
MDAIVLAGGLGTRLQSSVPDLPKCLAPINGKPFIDILLSHWKGQGVKKFSLSTGHLHLHIESHFKSSPFRQDVSLVREQSPQGTGGGIRNVLDKEKPEGPFLIMNGDTLFQVPLDKLLSFHQSRKAILTLALLPLHGKRYGSVDIDSSGKITAFGESAHNSPYVYGGVAICNDPGIFPSGISSFESDLMPRFIATGLPVYGFVSEDDFIDIGTPESFREAQSLLKEIP